MTLENELEKLIRNSILPTESIIHINDSEGDDKHSVSVVNQLILSTLEIQNTFEKLGKTRTAYIIPDFEYLPYCFTVNLLIRALLSGEIIYQYNPSEFKEGDKFLLDKKVLEFKRLEYEDNQYFITFNFPDEELIVREPLKILRVLEKTAVTRTPAKYNKVASKLKKIKEDAKQDFWEDLKEHKTYLNSSIALVTSLKKAKPLIESTSINENLLNEILLIGKANSSTELHKLNGEAIEGNPGLILSTEIEYIVNLINQGYPINTVVVEISKDNDFLNHSYEVDQLLEKNCTVIFLLSSSIAIGEELTNRNIPLWNWNEDSINLQMYGGLPATVAAKISNCKDREIHISFNTSAEFVEIKRIFEELNHIDDFSITIQNLINELRKIYSDSRKQIIELPKDKLNESSILLENLRKTVNNYKIYLGENDYGKLTRILDLLTQMSDYHFKSSKISALSKLMRDYHQVCIVVDNNTEIEKVREYWESIKPYSCELSILNVDEFLKSKDVFNSCVVLTGWYGKEKMDKILSSNNAGEYQLLLYPDEEEWCHKHFLKVKRDYDSFYNNRKTYKILNLDINENKQTSIDRLLLEITNHNLIKKTDNKNDDKNDDWNNKSNSQDKEEKTGFNVFLEPVANDKDHKLEQKSTKEILDSNNSYSRLNFKTLNREIKSKRYINKNSERDVILARQINLSNNLYLLLPLTHKNNVLGYDIYSQNLTTVLKSTDQLKEKDILVTLEIEKELIKKEADNILRENNQSELREKASRWKLSLQTESLFRSEEEISSSLQIHGCKKNNLTIKNWFNNREMIIPNDRQDLLFIAEVTKDVYLKDNIDEIYRAGRIVSQAHKSAGRNTREKLENELQENVSQYIKNHIKDWNDFSYESEKLGKIALYKIIKINDSNKLVQKKDCNKIFNGRN